MSLADPVSLDEQARTELLVEYQSIRESIRTISGRRSNVLLFTPSLWMAVAGVVISEGNPEGGWLQFGALAALLLPAWILIVNNLLASYDIARMLAYLDSFVEPFLPQLRYGSRFGKLPQRGPTWFSVANLGCAVATGLAILSWLFVVSTGSRPDSLALFGLASLELLTVAAAIGSFYVLSASDEFRAHWSERWGLVRSIEGQASVNELAGPEPESALSAEDSP